MIARYRRKRKQLGSVWVWYHFFLALSKKLALQTGLEANFALKEHEQSSKSNKPIESIFRRLSLAPANLNTNLNLFYDEIKKQ